MTNNHTLPAIVMNDTDLDQGWIKAITAARPAAPVMSEGKPTGAFYTPPCRLMFCEPPYGGLLSPAGKARADEVDKYTTAAIFPLGANLAALVSGVYQKAREEFPSYFGPNDAPGVMPTQLKSPIGSQTPSVGRGPGYIAGGVKISATTRRPPLVCDAMKELITDPAKVAAGYWAMLIVNPYRFEGKNDRGQVINRGIALGLQGVIMLRADRRFAGGVSISKDQAVSGLAGLESFALPMDGGPAMAASAAHDCAMCGCANSVSNGRCGVCGACDDDVPF